MKVTLIGAGNVGYHLGQRLFNKKIKIQQVYSRKHSNAADLAKIVKASPTNDLSTIDASADIYIIAVKDDAIVEVAAKLAKNKRLTKKIIVHTSGSVSSKVLAEYFSNYGVFYPLQTFTKGQHVYFKNIPICVDAKKEKSQKRLLKLGKEISKDVRLITDKERAVLHVAAVVVNNFTNHLFHIGATICKEEGLDFDILKPLIQETAEKLSRKPPYDMQTGPARRGDQQTIKKHTEYLKKFPKYQSLYTLLSESITNTYS